MIRLHVRRFNGDAIKNNSLTDNIYIFLIKEQLFSANRNHSLNTHTTITRQNNYTTKLNKLNDDNPTLPLYYVEVSQSPT